MIRIFFLGVLCLYFASPLSAEILSYKDDNGSKHYVDSINKVPERYRSQVSDGSTLPRISRLKAATYDNTPATTLGSNKKKIEIFVTSWCGYCKKLEAYLTEKQIAFKKYDIEKDPAAKSRYDEMGIKGVPVTKIGSEIIHGFDAGRLETLLAKK